MTEGPKYPVTTLIKAIEILNYLADESTPSEVDIKEISRDLNIGKSTVHRLLDTLLYYNYIKKSCTTGKYGLGWQMYNIGQKVLTHNHIYNLDRRFLETLSLKVKETVNLAVLNHKETVILSKIDYNDNSIAGSQSLIYESFYATSLGKVLVSEKSDDEILHFLDDASSLKPFTKYTITDPHEFLEEIKKVRDSGYAIDDQEYSLGLYCMACPIRDYTGNIIAAISISMPYVKVTDEIKETNLKYLMKCARTISTQMGHII